MMMMPVVPVMRAGIGIRPGANAHAVRPDARRQRAAEARQQHESESSHVGSECLASVERRPVT